MNLPLAIVSGAGPGLGQSLLNQLQSKGFNAVGLNRTSHDDRTLSCDLTVAADVSDVIAGLIQRFGPPKVVVHNPAKLVIAPFEETNAADFEATWRSMVLSLIHVAKATLPAMRTAGEGTFLVSGATASLKGSANFSAFSSAKFALRALTQSLAREYGPQGVHIAHVILDGILDTQASRQLHSLDPECMMDTEAVADVFLQVAQQPKSAWTHELDLRPMGETF